MYFVFFFFKQKTAYELRISDWSSDVCSSDLAAVSGPAPRDPAEQHLRRRHRPPGGRSRAAVAVPQAAGGRARHQCAAVPARLRARREPEEAAASCYILKPAVRTDSRLKINDLSKIGRAHV